MINQTAEGPHRDDDPRQYTPPEPGDEGYDAYIEELQQQRILREQKIFAENIRELESRCPVLKNRPPAPPERIDLNDEDMDRLYPEDVGKTPQELRARYLRTMHPATITDSARSSIMTQVNTNPQTSNALFDRNLSPSILRDNSNGFYIGTYDQFRAQYFDDYNQRDTASDGEIIQQLLAAQPHRIPGALIPGAAISTYGPLMLPESIDPINAATGYPAEIRPAQWTPAATIDEIAIGVARDILDSAAVYAARIKVATGHRPDSEGIDQLRKLTTVVKNAQKIMRNTSTPKRRMSPGRPRLKGLPGTIQVTTLKLEIAEKNKKFIPHKKRLATSAESTPEVQLNTLDATTT